MTACIPDKAKEQMNDGLQMMADWEFKKAIAQIELHKVRYGSYPNSLSELKFISPMDSSMVVYIDYTSYDSMYELNLKKEYFSFEGDIERVDLKYPAEFWKGLGCFRSNLK